MHLFARRNGNDESKGTLCEAGGTNQRMDTAEKKQVLIIWVTNWECPKEKHESQTHGVRTNRAKIPSDEGTERPIYMYVCSRRGKSGQVNTSKSLLFSSNHSWTLSALRQAALSCWKKPQLSGNTASTKGSATMLREVAGTQQAAMYCVFWHLSMSYSSSSVGRPWPLP